MIVVYRDELGVVEEKVDEDGIDFLNGNAYFNDKQIPMKDIQRIAEEIIL